ncbi:MAG: hypothetical protein K2P95_08095, partial [Hyphomonadaceae bacterium]|nr:hypothetical protein [Hyphomonadaceae bacterium]
MNRTHTSSDGAAATGTPDPEEMCAQEPIHIPGAIQPHGALLAFAAGEPLASASVRWASDNLHT